MASNGGRTDPPIAEALFDRGYEFEFFQAARLLARDGAWRTIKVNVNRPNTVARGKPGYYAK